MPVDAHRYIFADAMDFMYDDLCEQVKLRFKRRIFRLGSRNPPNPVSFEVNESDDSANRADKPRANSAITSSCIKIRNIFSKISMRKRNKAFKQHSCDEKQGPQVLVDMDASSLAPSVEKEKDETGSLDLTQDENNRFGCEEDVVELDSDFGAELVRTEARGGGLQVAFVHRD
ncbi:hypothetical protein DM02DRAFT_634963 [Periconia macrospinosa]|uniref:Uncharacterized protein n=1 Tax=Periconia macrospinosa TaxID=97972 RepID=A0A2V1D4K3_9PLEO|nr:hypothetical protein DM02DRAFT_634963 [Periconia macrospinosa]